MLQKLVVHTILDIYGFITVMTWLLFLSLVQRALLSIYKQGHHGYDRIVVGFTTTYAISVYHH
jgi:hypothetical protein